MSLSIEVTISPQGETRIETHGFTGGTCQDATRTLEAALGIREAERLTADFYTTADQTQNQDQKQ